MLDAMDSEQSTPSLSQAQRLKKYSQEGHLTLDMMRVIMGEEKKSDLDRVTFTSDTLRKYFPKSYTPQRMQKPLSNCWRRGRRSARESRNDERSRYEGYFSRELKGHNILAVERFQDNTRWMIRIFCSASLFLRQPPAMKMRLFLTEGTGIRPLFTARSAGKSKLSGMPVSLRAMSSTSAGQAPSPPVTPSSLRKERNEYVYCPEHQDAIRENCQSQHDMESTDIDQVLQALRFRSMIRRSVSRRSISVPTGPGRTTKTAEATVFLRKIVAFFMP